MTTACASSSEAAPSVEDEENVPKDEFIPREYQVELFEAAVKENTIVCLGTGTGKTFIAVMLIKEYEAAIRIPFEEGGKRTFFLVPTVPLVVQQQKAIKCQTDLRVGGYVGDMNVDNWNKQRWEKEFIESQVLVMTPDVFKVIIHHGFLKMSRVNLLILDECHRAVKQHTYREVMRCMDVLKPEEKPRVLGLTASVINSKATERQVERKVHDLEMALHSRVLTVSNQQSMARYGTKPIEVLVEHHTTGSPSICGIQVPTLPNFRPTTSQGQELDRRLRSLIKVLHDMGVWCGHLAIEVIMEEARRMLDGLDDDCVLREVEVCLEWLDEVRKRCRHHIVESNTAAQSVAENPLLALATPKLKRLLEILWASRPREPQHAGSGDAAEPMSLCGIIFVKERIVARILRDWLLELANKVPRYSYIVPEFIVGHGANLQLGSKEAGMSFKKQCKVLEQFRRQECNLLVATSVVEEGMDVPKCSLVVRFDFPDDFRSYVQSKGRARAQRSLYIMMTARDDYSKACVNLRNYLSIEAILMNKCHERKAPHSSEVVLSFAVDELLPPYMPVREDGAPRITLTSAIGLVNRYCMVLPSDMFTHLKPTYQLSTIVVDGKELYICTVYLPMTSPLKEAIQGRPMETKKYAKMAAALETCKRLHQMNEFDSCLLPVKRVLQLMDDSDNEEADDAPPGAPKPGTKKCRRVYQKRVCKLFAEARVLETGHYRLHILTTQLVRLASDIQNWRKEKLVDPEDCPLWFGLLLREDMPCLPSFPIFTRSGDELVSVVRAGPVHLSSAQCLQLQLFHHAIWHDVLRMKERPLLQFDMHTAPNCPVLVPVIKDGDMSMIDWSFVGMVADWDEAEPTSRAEFQFQPSLYEDAVVVPRYAPLHYHHSTFYVKKIRTDLTVDSIDGKGSFRDYLSLIHHLEVTDSTQPILEVVFTEVRLNLLTPRYRNRKGDVFIKKTATNRRTELRVPEFCDVHPVPASVWRKAVCLPSILYRLNQLLVVEELRASVAMETGIGLGTYQGPWPDLDFQSAVSESASISFLPRPDYDEVEFGNLLRGHGEAEEIRMPRLSRSFEYQPELRGNPGPSPGLLLEAVTSAKAADGFDLERLEVLGDSFLKFAVTIDLFCGSTSAQEGLLTQTRSRIICNRNLHQLGSKIHVGSMVAQEQFEPHRNWLPPGYRVPEGAEDILMDVNFVFWAIQVDTKILEKLTWDELYSRYKQYRTEKEQPGYVPPPRNTSGPVPIRQSSQLSDKSVADSVEAIIGAYLLVTGPIGALRVMKWMGLKLKQCNLDAQGARDEGTAVPFMGFPAPRTSLLRYTDDPEGRLASQSSPWHGRLCLVEQTLGYTFRDRSYLLQACTHASFYQNRLTDCYQRLEFLGDAVIDYLVTRYLYEGPHKFNPGQLTDLRSSLVNNTFFAALVVRHGLHRCLLHCNPGLFNAVSRFVQHQERSSEDELGTSSEDEDAMAEILDLNAQRDKVSDNPTYWKVLQRFYYHEEECLEPEEVEVPKALGDLFESLMGAVFLDCGMSLDTVWRILYRLFGREIESFSERVPLPPIRTLLEKFPDARFSPAEVLKNEKVKVELILKDRTFTCVAKSKKLAKTALAKKCLRMMKTCGSG
ncbi:endoribonuclease Dicer-like [Dermacentor albipictus]|uniref:endoribonuclease Dicer-like n=1 Tax=Dermacentor albipictus TaxID=60249 RepID=UPI0038FC2B94